MYNLKIHALLFSCVVLVSCGGGASEGGGSSSGGSSSGGPITTPDLRKSGVFLNNKETLRKAAIILAHRLPTETELASVGSESALRNTVKGLMQGEGFSRFIYDTAEEWFLPAGVFEGHFRAYQTVYPNLSADGLGSNGVADGIKFNRALAELRREPLEITRFIVENDRSWKEILTAKYTVMSDEFSAAAFASSKINNLGAVTVRQNYSVVKTDLVNAGTFPGVPFPHAGVLTTLAWLNRFPTTYTNRNRHRVRMLYRQFLGVDIEALGERPAPEENLTKYEVPVRQNPDCTLCHSFMDPVAGALHEFSAASFGQGAIFKVYATPGFSNAAATALGPAYVSSRLPSGDYPQYKDKDGKPLHYVAGDAWYRDMFEPGVAGVKMPGDATGYVAGSDDPEFAVQWTANQLVKNEAFPLGGVRFWYRGVFGHEAQWRPFDDKDPTYNKNLAAFEVENKALTKIAENFEASNFKVKSLLLDFVMSDLFRIKALKPGVSDIQKEVLRNIGLGRLLRRTELNGKAESIISAPMLDGAFPSSPWRMVAIYTGFDGGNDNLVRNKQVTPLLLAAREVGVLAGMCDDQSQSLSNGNTRVKRNAVNQDFKRAVADRKMFTEVELTDTATSSETQIRQQIQKLHLLVLGQYLETNDAEITRTFELFKEVQTMTLAPDSKYYICETTAESRSGGIGSNPPNFTDSNGTIRAWTAVLFYLFTDLDAIIE